jgi:hypothetical protein
VRVVGCKRRGKQGGRPDSLGDPFAPKGQRLHDRPDMDAVNSDLHQMAHQYDDLHVDAGMGPTRIPGPGSAAEHDARFELESQMRNRTLFGPQSGNPLEHGHVMATTLENYIRYAPGAERRAITDTAIEQEEWADDLYADYATIYPELAADTAGLSAAIDYTMNQLRWHGEHPARWARQHPQDFLKDVAANHSAGFGRRESAGDSNRTAGIISSGSAARQPQPADTMSDHDWMQELQRRKGIY